MVRDRRPSVARERRPSVAREGWCDRSHAIETQIPRETGVQSTDSLMQQYENKAVKHYQKRLAA